MFLGRVDDNVVPLLDDPARNKHAHAVHFHDLVVRHRLGHELRPHLASRDTQTNGGARLREAQ